MVAPYSGRLLDTKTKGAIHSPKDLVKLHVRSEGAPGGHFFIMIPRLWDSLFLVKILSL